MLSNQDITGEGFLNILFVYRCIIFVQVSFRYIFLPKC